MALKGDRITSIPQDIRYFMYTTGERGSIVVLDTSHTATGVALDDPENVVKLPANQFGSGEVPVGLLLNDVVNVDLTKYKLNEHKDEVQVYSKVTVARRGTYTTNWISGSPSPGDKAYIGEGGALTNVTGNHPGTAGALSTQVGRWISSKDSDGYATVEINIV